SATLHDDFHRNSSRVERYRRRFEGLGLDDSYARYVGTTGFTVGNLLGDEKSLGEFKRRTSYLRLGYFFLSHPPTFYRVFSFALGQAGRQRPNLGNFDSSAGRPPYAESRNLILWSRLKRSLFYWKGARYLSYSIAVMMFSSLVAATRASNECLAPVCLLAVAALMEIGIAGLGDAAETTRHCFLFNSLLARYPPGFRRSDVEHPTSYRKMNQTSAPAPSTTSTPIVC